MNIMWQEAAAAVTAQVVRIETPRGFGTGFVTHSAHDLRGVATAYHVIEEAVKEDLLITVHYGENNTVVMGPGSERERLVIRGDPKNSDSGLLLFPNASDLPEPQVKTIQYGNTMLPATEVAWIGFPDLVPDKPCFFSGRISANLDDNSGAYLIDGVAISGVSGGPIFFLGSGGEPIIIGSISGYRYNLTLESTHYNGNGVESNHMIALPGMSDANDVSLVTRFEIDEAPDSGTKPISERVRFRLHPPE